ncbi:TetR/AcrR family transcriptional regulator [Mangrovimicrobium sediminis]|uniref:TetR/AcrR family transcriptional regulator n=1 Tax=Mangrovimicrobium sediminis TaxID=2562682 RepID=A0A4Z0LUL4_9GAMM|nr:TetR/AcrR family transcriptional regulator [Haliea sp. SAOS-164]TGD70970.1 TetR/AcrR family transcriptional regulator [Haliea sp. SAOS-164]
MSETPAVYTASRSSANRQHAILMAALACFNERGIEGAAIGEIGRRAGASVGSMYHHFGSKEGIALALLAEGLHSSTRLLEEKLATAQSAREGVTACVIAILEWVRDNPEWARFIYTVTSTRLWQGDHPELHAVNARNAELMATYFGPYLACGELRALPTQCLPSLVLGPAHDYARRWLNGQVEGDIEAHAEVFAEAAWRVVSNVDQT